MFNSSSDDDTVVDYDEEIKVVVLGESGVGKSNIINRYNGGQFDPNSVPNNSSFFMSKNLKFGEKVYRINLWDTAGQEKYHSLTKIFLNEAKIAVLIYAINDKASFENLDIWLKDLKKDASPDIKTILIGNKCDLESERKIKKFVAETYAKDFGFLNFFETSAKTGFNSQKVFINSALILYEDYKQYEKQGRIGYDQNEEQSSTQLSRKKKVQKTGSCC